MIELVIYAVGLGTGWAFHEVLGRGISIKKG